jgi:hypothetical protein
MTLLRRAPREVYRVYAEHEFLADALCDEPLRTREASAGRPLHRIVAATVLIAAAGALGALIALESLQSIPGSRRRERQRSAAATATATAVVAVTRASHPGVRRERGGRGRPRRRSPRPQAARRAPDPVSPAGQRVQVGGLAPIPERAPAPESAGAPEGPPSPAGAPVAAAGSPVAVSAAASTAAAREEGQSEFGFERR